jgi:hypothetical protein
MGKQQLRNLANLGSWSSYKKLPTYKKSKEENKENVSNQDIQSDNTYRIPLKWMPYLLLEDSRVKGGYINKSVLLSAGCPPQGATHLDGKLAIWALHTS